VKGTRIQRSRLADSRQAIREINEFLPAKKDFTHFQKLEKGVDELLK